MDVRGIVCAQAGFVLTLRKRACRDLAGWGIKGRLAPELAGLDHLQHL